MPLKLLGPVLAGGALLLFMGSKAKAKTRESPGGPGEAPPGRWAVMTSGMASPMPGELWAFEGEHGTQTNPRIDLVSMFAWGKPVIQQRDGEWKAIVRADTPGNVPIPQSIEVEGQPDNWASVTSAQRLE